jgi:hypothetical protein
VQVSGHESVPDTCVDLWLCWQIPRIHAWLIQNKMQTTFHPIMHIFLHLIHARLRWGQGQRRLIATTDTADWHHGILPSWSPHCPHGCIRSREGRAAIYYIHPPLRPHM